MWAEACALLDEAERRHRRFYELLAVPSPVPVWEPPANIFARGAEVHVMVALPGARSEDVVAQVTPSGLLIEANVPPPAFEAGVEVVRLEIPYGRMRRRFELPPGTYTVLENRLDRGYLFLRLAGSSR
jgi:HSP20 family molecular chaperone IbpA